MSDQDDKKDLTRIEDLSEYLHEEDETVNSQLDTGLQEAPPTFKSNEDELPGINDLENESSSENVLDFSGEEDEFEEDAELSFDSEEDEDESESSAEELSFDSEEDDEELSFENNEDDVANEESLDFSLSEENTEEDENSTQLYDEEDGFGPLSYPETSNDEQTEPEEDEDLSFNSEESENTDFAGTFEESSSSDFSEPSTEFSEEPMTGIEELNEAPMEEPVALEKREDFSDIRAFTKNISYGTITAGGNPPFSIILKNIKYREHAEDIIALLKEYSLLTDNDEDMFRKSAEAGSAIIPQISEYAAILLTHKLRRFELNIMMGLSEEIHPSKSYSASDYRGLISKENLLQNKSDSQTLSQKSLTEEEIILTTTPELSGLIIREYLGIVTDHKVIDIDEIKREFEIQKIDEHPDYIDSEKFKTDTYYNELTHNLRPKAHKLGANAVIDIKFNLTPLLSQNKDESLYKLTCTGNAVFTTD